MLIKFNFRLREREREREAPFFNWVEDRIERVPLDPDIYDYCALEIKFPALEGKKGRRRRRVN